MPHACTDGRKTNVLFRQADLESSFLVMSTLLAALDTPAALGAAQRWQLDFQPGSRLDRNDRASSSSGL